MGDNIKFLPHESQEHVIKDSKNNNMTSIQYSNIGA